MMATYGTYFAIHDIHIRYLMPARLDDLLLIKTEWERKKNCSLLFKQTMHNQQNQCLSEADVHVVCVNQELRPKPLPKVWLA
jgi:acyl-CoA thioester hydrolase